MDTIQYIEQLKRRVQLSAQRDREFYDSLHEDLIRLDHELEEIKDMLNLDDSTLDFNCITPSDLEHKDILSFEVE